MCAIHFHYFILSIIAYNCFAMDNSKKSIHKNKIAIYFSGFSQLPIPAIAGIFTGSPYLSIPATHNDDEKDFRQREAICLYSNPSIRNALLQVDKSYHRLFSWENINPLMCSASLRAEDEDIHNLFLRVTHRADLYTIEKLKAHPSLNYSVFNTQVFIIGSQQFISLANLLHPLARACIVRSAQEVANYFEKNKKCKDLAGNDTTEILDLCFCSLVQNNDHNSLTLILNNKFMRRMITTLPVNYINKFVQLGIYCGSHRVIRQLASLYTNPHSNSEKDYIINNFKSGMTAKKNLFGIISDNMQLLRERNGADLHNLFYCLHIFFPSFALEKLGLTQHEIQSIVTEISKHSDKKKAKKKKNSIISRMF